MPLSNRLKVATFLLMSQNLGRYFSICHSSTAAIRWGLIGVQDIKGGEGGDTPFTLFIKDRDSRHEGGEAAGTPFTPFIKDRDLWY